MAKDLTVKALIEILLKDKGAREAAAAILKTGEAAKKATPQLAGMDAATSALGRKLATYFSAAALGAFAVSAVRSFATIERAFNALRIQMEGLLGTAADLPHVKAFLEALQDAGDGMLTETVPAFQTFLGLTKSVPAALTMVKLASGIAEGSTASFGEAVGVVSALLSGRAARSLKDFGINMAEAEDGTVDAAAALKILAERFLTVGDRLDDTKDKLDRATGRWEKFKEAAGGAMLSVVEGTVSATQKLLDFAAVQIATLRGPEKLAGVRILIAARDAGGKVGEQFGAGLGVAAEIAGKAAGAKLTEEQVKLGEKLREQALKIGSEIAGKELDAAEKAAQEKKEIEIGALKSRLEQELAILNDSSVKRLDLEKGWEQRIAQEKLNIQLELLGLARAKAIQEATDKGASGADVEAAFDLAAVALFSQTENARAAKALETALTILDVKEHEKKETIRISNEKTEAEIANAQLNAQMQRQAALDIARTSLATLGIVFGQNKAFAIAQAMINTYESATGALAAYSLINPTLGTALAAAYLAQGFAYVRQIMKQTPGGTSIGGGGGGGRSGGKSAGFDDPGSDALAVHAGRKWARDWIDLTSRGFRQEIGDYLGSRAAQVTNDNRQSFNQTLNISGMYGGREGIRQLRRELVEAEIRDRSRKLR